MTRMSPIRYAICAAVLVGTLWAQNAATAPGASSQPRKVRGTATSAKPDDEILGTLPANTVRVPQSVTQGLVIHRVEPIYPSLALKDKVQGAVVLVAIISKEGTIKDLQVISGDPLLNQAALDAVKQWRYKRYILNGEPVEVQTAVTVNFTLP